MLPYEVIRNFGPVGPDLCRISQANFTEFSFHALG